MCMLGSCTKKLFNGGVLDKENSLSFAFNTDGIPLFKSSKVSMWPVYLMINELPIAERKLRENVLFHGIWISAKKPIMWSFLKPLYEELPILEDGVQMTDHTGQSFICKAVLLTCTCDLPARCLGSNSVQFNGKHSCWFCMQEGESCQSGKGHCHIFPFQEEDPKGPACTMHDLKSDVDRAMLEVRPSIRRSQFFFTSWNLFLELTNWLIAAALKIMFSQCLFRFPSCKKSLETLSWSKKMRP